ncbi:MAG: RNA-binding protein [Hyphomonadaceae bacterium]|nr:RNA-binding protein [Hyphomonadaceae bacterium]
MPPPANSHDDLTGIDPALETPIPETDGGPPRVGKGARDPERRCIVTMEHHPQSEMIRFVLSPDGGAVADLAARLPGRGAWVTSTRDAIEGAVKKGAFSRAFKAQAKTPPDLPAQVEHLLAKRVLDQLGLAKRAGELILGFEQVREAIRNTTPGCVIEASDGAEDGRSKMLGLLRAVHGPERDGSGNAVVQDEQAENQRFPPVIGCFSADELGMALGRERVIHACLKQGRFAQGWMGELKRLSGFRRVWPEDWQPSSARGGGRPEADASHDAAAGQKN